MRIFLITSSYPRHPNDIAGHFVKAQVDALIQRGHEVTIFTWQDANVDDTPSLTPQNGVYRVPYMPKKEWQTLFYGDGSPENLSKNRANFALTVPAIFSMMCAVYRVSKEISPPDLYLGHWVVPGGLIASWAGRFFHKPFFIVGHSGGIQLINKLPKSLRGQIFSYLYPKRCDRQIYLWEASITSRALRETFPIDLRERIKIMPMGFEAHQQSFDYCRRRRERGDQRTELRSLFLGRLVPIKGTSVGIKASINAGIPVDVVGDGPLLEPLKSKYSNKLVSFHGALFGDSKECLMQQATLSLHPSLTLSGRHEGMPVSILECAAAGLIPLISGVPGAEEIVVRPWQLFPEGDVDALTQRLIGWQEGCIDGEKIDKNQLVAEQSSKVQALVWDRYIVQWEALFEALVERSKKK